MIPLVRIHAESDFTPPGLEHLASSGPLALLQLDYARPRITPVVGAATPELPELAQSFPDALRQVCRTLFLEPDFRVITSGGWSNAYGGVEEVAAALVDGGSPELLVSAVRGSNLLGILEFLLADGMQLTNADTGAPWKTLREPILAADLQIGAGPIATALAEGARVVVAGCYDGAAPAIASAVHQFGWAWSDRDALAGAAAAARAALWPLQHAWDASLEGSLRRFHPQPRITLDSSGGFTVDVNQPVEAFHATSLLQWLHAGKRNDPAHLHADVQFDASKAVVIRTGPNQLRVDGCTGAKADGHWRVEVLYLAAYVAETVLEFIGRGGALLRRQVGEAFGARFVDADTERSLVTVQEIGGGNGGGNGGGDSSSWLHVACRTKSRTACTAFVEELAAMVSANRTVVRLPAGKPAVNVECGMWPARVPRSAIDIAVDTRAAHEWV
ncbi:MAG TPA: acyclic terpene utilization AtuA family protein [Lacipirellulaceae bacterium]|nr:acyclic terpene utilization AtuA family protein [Lacipirellulaceae bacterium]